jgi:two-component sensor histidine kinase
MPQMQIANTLVTTDRNNGSGSLVVPGSYDGNSPDLIFAREIGHRICNQLMSTISLMSRTAARSGNSDVQVALAGVIEHLHDCAQVYRALQMPTGDHSIDAAQYLRGLCRVLRRVTLQDKGIELVLVERPLQLGLSQCWRLGMIVAELITNACRHAFDNKGRSITVEFESRGRYVECRVADDGSAKEDIRPGQGFAIIQHLAAGLNGEISLRFGETGSMAIVSFPIVESAESN